MFIEKLLLEFTGGLLVSSVGFALTTILLNLPWILRKGRGRVVMFLGVFLALPAGSLSGIVLVDKVVYGYQDFNWLGLVVGLALSIISGGILANIMVKKSDRMTVILIPLVVVLFSLLGYRIPLFSF